MLVKVLVADDHPMIREIVREYLELFPDEFTVVAAVPNGYRAVEAVFEHNPDVVLMDVRLPVIDGIEATRIIKSKGHPARVVACTSFLYDQLKQMALDAGASAHISKPFDLHRLRTVLMETAAPAAGSRTA